LQGRPLDGIVGRAGDDLIRRLLDLSGHRTRQRTHPQAELVGSHRYIILGVDDRF
jgi:hypothetical protein